MILQAEYGNVWMYEVFLCLRQNLVVFIPYNKTKVLHKNALVYTRQEIYIHVEMQRCGDALF